MAKTSELGRKITWLRGEIARLQAMVDYLTAAEPETAPKRERKTKKKIAAEVAMAAARIKSAEQRGVKPSPIDKQLVMTASGPIDADTSADI